MTESSSKKKQRDAEPGAKLSAQDARDLSLIIGGSIVAFLGPLFGFLGGSMVGSTRTGNELDPLFLSLFLGLVLGGLGAFVAFVGGLRWVRRRP
jgi:hypothetical protein